jgi:hypothetical protein
MFYFFFFVWDGKVLSFLITLSTNCNPLPCNSIFRHVGFISLSPNFCVEYCMSSIVLFRKHWTRYGGSPCSAASPFIIPCPLLHLRLVHECAFLSTEFPYDYYERSVYMTLPSTFQIFARFQQFATFRVIITYKSTIKHYMPSPSLINKYG